MQARRRRVRPVLAARPVRLQLVEAVQRHVETITALVLDDGDVERALPHDNRLQAAVDADAVLQVHHVVARLQRARGRGARPLPPRSRGAVAAGAAQPPRPPEDLVVGEHPQAGQDEAGVERPDDEGGAVGAEQFLETLELSLVVAQDHRRRLARRELAQPLYIAIHRLGGQQRKALRGIGGARREPREAREPRAPRRRIEREVLARRRLLAEAPRHLEVMRRIRPGAVHLAFDGGLLIDHHQRVRRKQVQQGGSHPSRFPLPPFGPDRQHGHAIDPLARALRVQIESAQRLDRVAPPLDAGRPGHPETVDVEDPAAHAELPDLGHAGHALVAHRAQPRDYLAERARSPFPRPRSPFQHHALRLERRRHPRALGARPRRRHHHAGAARQQRRDRLDALARDLDVRLVGAEPLALRVQHGGFTHELPQVREPALGVGGGGGHDREQPLWEPARHRGHEQRGSRAGEAGER